MASPSSFLLLVVMASTLRFTLASQLVLQDFVWDFGLSTVAVHKPSLQALTLPVSWLGPPGVHGHQNCTALADVGTSQRSITKTLCLTTRCSDLLPLARTCLLHLQKGDLATAQPKCRKCHDHGEPVMFGLSDIVSPAEINPFQSNVRHQVQVHNSSPQEKTQTMRASRVMKAIPLLLGSMRS